MPVRRIEHGHLKDVSLSVGRFIGSVQPSMNLKCLDHPQDPHFLDWNVSRRGKSQAQAADCRPFLR